MMRAFRSFFGTLVILLALAALAHVYLGAGVGEECNDFLLSCRATRGFFTLNACVHTGPTSADSFCSYACRDADECPEGWTCDPASAWSAVPGTLDDVERVCRRPHSR